MATYTVERAYWVPIYQHITLEADSPETAMRAALASNNWDSAKTDYDSSRAEHVTGCWEGDEAYSGDCLPIPVDLEGSLDERPLATAPAMLAALQQILEGSDHDGRWLDQDGNECAEDDEGAEWVDFSEEEQAAWLEGVARIARAAIAAATD